MIANKFDHIGIAVKSIEDTLETLGKLFQSKKVKIETHEALSLKIAIICFEGIKLELIQPIDDNEIVVNKYLNKRGEGIHHLAFLVESVQKSLDNAKSIGFELIDQVPRKGAQNKYVGFLNPKSTNGCLIEFCSHSK